ncbi:MAG: response regulator transcription factor [Chitinophagaceae bacterium]|nr:response regulator transcription factor [Chitinophagaceae bacterium]
MKRSKIVLADDHQFLLEGILSILKEEPDLEIAATVNNGIDLMEAVAQHKPQLAILDLNMPGYDGLKCLQKIKTNFSETKVLVLTNYMQPELVEEVRKMKAEGYLIKNSSAAALKEAVQTILSGGTSYPAADELKSTPDDSYFFDEFLKKYQLTKREVQIIRMVCQEKSTKQIATELYLSELTINTHRRNIFRKLELNNVAGLMNFARQNQLL